MSYIVLGALAFILVHLFDVVSLLVKKISRLKLYVWVLASGLLIYAVTGASLHPGKLPLPAWISWMGWALFFPALFLFLYSLFINLPFSKTYRDAESERLIKVSLYALIRHPGVYFSCLTLISLILVSHSILLLTAALIWEGLDILLIFIDDYYTFSRMFPGYDEYRRETPMFIPSRKSLRAFRNSTGKR